jgi:hypothetical protein
MVSAKKNFVLFVFFESWKNGVIDVCGTGWATEWVFSMRLKSVIEVVWYFGS